MPLLSPTGLKRVSHFLRSSIANRQASLVSSGLVFHFDPSNPACYPGTGTVCTDLTGVNGNGTMTAVSFVGGNHFRMDYTYSDVVFNRAFTNTPSSYTLMVVAEVPSTGPGFYPALFGCIQGTLGGIALYSYQDSGTPAFGVTIADDPGDLFDDIQGGTPGSVAPSIRVGAGVLDSTSLKLYCDGILRATSSPRSGGVINAGPKIFIGNSDEALWNTWMGTKIFHAVIYNRPLSDSEILQNYNFLKVKYSLS